MKFPESALAHRYLDGLVGVEIGGAAHNPFGLSTWNVDQLSHLDPRAEIYASEQRRQCGEVLPVDVVAAGDRLPIRDGGIDFVVSSHVIEHFFDPVGALAEWARAARCYVLIICPQRDALGSDRALPLTRSPRSASAPADTRRTELRPTSTIHGGPSRRSARCASSTASSSSPPRTPTPRSATASPS